MMVMGCVFPLGKCGAAARSLEAVHADVAAAACWELALKKERLSAALKTKLLPEDVVRLREHAAGLPVV